MRWQLVYVYNERIVESCFLYKPETILFFVYYTYKKLHMSGRLGQQVVPLSLFKWQNQFS